MKIFTHLFFIVVFVFTSNAAFAVTKTFNVTSGNWNVASNWSPVGVPGANDDYVVIPTGKTCTITADVTQPLNNNPILGVAGTLIINSSVTLTIIYGLTLDDGGIITNNGTIVMTATAGNGLWLIAGSTINNTGTITVASGSFIQLEGTLNSTGTVTNNGFIGNSDHIGSSTFSSSRYTNPSGATVGGPGSIDCVTFSAGLTNNGIMEFDVIDGSGACTGHDQFAVTGASMIFGGTFTVVDWYGIPVNTDLVVMTYPSRTGAFTNSYVDIGGGKYANISYGATALTLEIRNTIILPVELTAFDAKITKTGKTHLNWATASEHNNEGFEIEKSTDGTRFEKIGFVAGAGNSSEKKEYAFEDASAFERSVQVVYYRLRQVDYNGAYEYSKIISVKNTTGNTNVKIYPTTTSGLLTVEAEGASVDVVTVVNQVGQVVLTAQKVNSVDMSALPAGLYLVQVQAGQEQWTERVFKQ